MTKTKFSWLYCLIAVLSLLFVLSSCDKDKDEKSVPETTENESGIVGIWQFKQTIVELDGETHQIPAVNESYYQFNDDKTFYYIIINKKVNVNKGEWSINDGKLLLVYANDNIKNQEYNIKSLSSGKLLWSPIVENLVFGDATGEKGDVFYGSISNSNTLWEYERISSLPESAIGQISK